MKYNVICIKWGNYYGAPDVNHLCRAIKRHTQYDIDFYCFTDDPNGLDQNIVAKPMTKLNCQPPEDTKYAYRKEAGLCDNDLGGLNGQRVFFFDLDSLIVGNLDEFFEYPRDDKFYIINCWRHRGGRKKNKVGQASCYSFVVGTLGYVKEYFETHPREVIAKYHTASQEFLSDKVREKWGGPLNFWPDSWFKSFYDHCMPQAFLRWFVTPRLPNIKGLKMIAFHGPCGIEEAIEGVFTHNKNYFKGIRRYTKGWYKHVKPCPWILDYWK